MSALPALREQRPAWVLALSASRYDRSPVLSARERAAVSELAGSRTRWPADLSLALARLTAPIDDVLSVVCPQAAWWGRYPARRALVAAMAGSTEAFWGWDRDRWAGVAGDSDAQIRQTVLAVAYLLCGQHDLNLEPAGSKRGCSLAACSALNRSTRRSGRSSSTWTASGRRPCWGARTCSAR